jgi:metal-dependent amidase/aminoacylase/carboxypeptidase family protein
VINHDAFFALTRDVAVATLGEHCWLRTRDPVRAMWLLCMCADGCDLDSLRTCLFSIPPRAQVMGAEDFAYVLQRMPGGMYWLGVTPRDKDVRVGCVGCVCVTDSFDVSHAAHRVVIRRRCF